MTSKKRTNRFQRSQVYQFMDSWTTSATGRVVEDLNAAASSAAFSASVGTSLTIVNARYDCVWRLGGLFPFDTHGHVRHPLDRGIVALNSSRVPEIQGACLGPRCDHNVLHRAAFLQL